MDDYSGLAPDDATQSNTSTIDGLQPNSDDYSGLAPDDTTNSNQTVQTTTQPPINDDNQPKTIDTPMAEAPFNSEQVENPDSMAVAAIKDSPVGLASNAVQTGMKGLGKATNLMEEAYSGLAGPLAPNPQTALEAATNVEQIPESGLKDLTQIGENVANGKGSLEGLSSGTPSWSDLVKNAPLVNKLPDDVKEQIGKTLGIPSEAILDPMWVLSPFGKTTIGEAAEKEAMLEPNVAKAGQVGERALLTAGGKPLIQGQPVLNAIGKGQDVLRKYFPGFHTLTDNPVQNALIESKLKSPENYANVQADIQGAYRANQIAQEAEKMNMTPLDLSKRIMDFVEADGPRREQMAQGLTPEAHAIAAQLRQNFGQMSENEGFTKNDQYLPHIAHPDYLKFLKDTYDETNPNIESAAPKSDEIGAHDPRNAQGTANEVNNLASQGRLGEAYPNSKYKDVLNRYTGKVFSDDIAQIEANRFLQNAKVNRVADFMDAAGKTFGKTDEAHAAGMSDKSIGDKEYTWVPSDHYEDGGMWFPKQMGDFMKGLQNPSNADRVQGWASKFLEGTSTATKLINFGLKPASAPFNYLSNLNLAYLNKGLNLKNVDKALGIITHDRLGTLSDKTALTLKDGTKISEKQLMDMAYKNRGIGMGLEKSEIGQARMANWMRDNPFSKNAMSVHMYAEDASRLPVFMTYLEQGYTPEAAAKATREALYDYSDLGKRDQKIAQYIPFYRFARLNMPRMIEKMITDPARTFAVEKTREAWNKSEGQDQNERLLPDYIKGEEPWYAGQNEQGEPLWVQGGRYSTQNDINRPIGSADEFGEFHPGQGIERYLAGMANPALKLIPEELANTNFAQNIPIARDTHANGGLGEEKNLAPGINLPAKLQYATNQLSPFSMARASADQNVPLTYRLLHELGGINVTAQDLDQANLSKEIGIKSDIQGLKRNVEYFGRKAANDADKDPNQEKLDEENFQNSLQEYEDLSQKLLQGVDNDNQ